MQFIYTEPIKNKLPLKIKIHANSQDNTHEAILIRLFSGTINFSNIELNTKQIKQRTNYFLFTCNTNYKVNKTVLENINPLYSNTDINRYFSLSMNKKFFEELVHELSCSIYFKSMKQFTTSFIHIYRFLEHISITFPLHYTSISNDYNNSFGELKQLFSESGNGGGLKFHKIFMTKLFDQNDTTLPYHSTISLDYSFLDQTNFDNIKKSFITVISSEKSLKIGDFNFSNKIITFKFNLMHDLIITFRNRFFHSLVSQPHNISSIYFVSEDFFRVFNEYALNWLGYLFNEITEKRIQSFI